MDKRLQKVEDYIVEGDFYSAQNLLNMIDEESGKKCYLQSLIYKEKCWYNEQRKMLKKAIKAEPENLEYKKEFDELLEFCKTSEYKDTVQHPTLGEKSGACVDCLSACLLSCGPYY